MPPFVSLKEEKPKTITWLRQKIKQQYNNREKHA